MVIKDMLIKYKVTVTKILLLFLVYILIFLSYSFLLSTKLNLDEYEAVSTIYDEMRVVDSTIKNEFYTSSLLKYLDKGFIIEELRKDSLRYALVVNERYFSILSETDVSSAKTALSYVSRCDLNFESFVSLGTAEDLFTLFRDFLASYSLDIDKLNMFGSDLYDIVDKERNILTSIFHIRLLKLFLFSFSYFFILYVLVKKDPYFYKFFKKQ